jgi:class 3 adenylate cyclase/DNA-binding response OmpR family regulator
MNKLRTLVIDDSAQVRDFVVDYILKPQGFAVEVAVNGTEGLHKALNYQPDLILTDYEMPKLNGLELLQALRRHGCKAPVILMTSHGSEQIAVEVFRLGVYDYLVKPFAPQDMLNAVENALSVTRLQQEKESLTQRILSTNQQLRQHLDELNALYEVGKSITSLMQPDKLLDRIVNAVLAVTRSEECTLIVIDPKSGEVKGHLTRERADLVAQTEAANMALVGPLTLANNSAPVNYLTEKVLSVPLQIGSKVLGKLSISKQMSDDFTPHDHRLMAMLADYSAIAIHNIQLVHQLQLTKEREKQQIRSLFERFVAPPVVEQLLAQPEKVSLGGMRQTITILFADLRGFSQFSSLISPEILVDLLNQYLRVGADAILAQEGTMDKFMGDAVMAFFNAPLPQPDHMLRGVRAACALRQAVRELHQELPKPYHLEFGIGLGVGEAVVGNVGTAQMMNYTVIGDSVNKVKRLQESAKGGQILINEETYHLLRNDIEAQPLGPFQLKGQSQTEMIYAVLGLA